MSSTDKDLGIISVLLKRFEAEELPAILAMKKEVEAGNLLSDGDIEILHRMLAQAEADHLGALLERHPDYRDLAASVFSTCRQIIERALENEERVRRRPD
jgi:hypothetical protein